jgi:serine/threonine-protein kinase
MGVVHRDLKPDNIFITRSTGGPVVKLLDFGIAKLRQTNEYTKGLTRPGAVMGTPEYMAPEQLYAAERVDYRADLYSLGAILYEMLSGERPAYGDDAQQIIAQVLEGNVKRITDYEPELPQALVDAVHRALAADKNQRFESAMHMRLALAAFAGELSHAGRLAATPVPAADIPSPEPPAANATVDVAPPRSGAVPPTLPPDDEPGTRLEPVVQKGGTQEAPKQLMQQLGSGTQATPGAPSAGYPLPVAPGTPYFATNLGPSYAGYGPPPRRRKRALGAVAALLLGVLITGAAIALIVVNQRSPEEPAPELASPDLPPPTTIAAQPDQPAPEPLPPSPPRSDPVQPSRPAPSRPGQRPSARDAGADAGRARTDAGPFGPFPPFSLPSAWPPGIPTLPPGFQIPGLPPPPGQTPPAGN